MPYNIACVFCFAIADVNIERPDRSMCQDCYHFVFGTIEPAQQAYRLGALMTAREAQPKKSKHGQAVRDLAQLAEDERIRLKWLTEEDTPSV